MAQTDITTFAPIVLWTFILFSFSFLFFSTYLMPVFVNKTKILLKIKNITFFNTMAIIDRIRIIENFYVVLKLKTVLKSKR